jgi:hypothetical protein
VAIACDRIDEAIEHLRTLLDEHQQPPPQALNKLVEAAIHVAERSDRLEIRRHVQAALLEARHAGYL